MWRVLPLAFALFVAIAASLLITTAAQSASESFRANLHNASVITR